MDSRYSFQAIKLDDDFFLYVVWDIHLEEDGYIFDGAIYGPKLTLDYFLK